MENDFDPMPILKFISKSLNRKPFMLLTIEPETGDVRQFSNAEPEDQLAILEYALAATTEALALKKPPDKPH